MSIHQQPGFFDYVHSSGNSVNNLFESYFFYEGISGKLGGHKFELIDKEGHIKAEQLSKKLTVKDVIINIVKGLSLLTLIIPLGMYIGKKLNRQNRHYTVIKNSSADKVHVATKEWKKGFIENVQSTQSAAAALIKARKEETATQASEALNLIEQIKIKTRLRDPKDLQMELVKQSEREQIYVGKYQGTPFKIIAYPKYKMTRWVFENKGLEINEYAKGAYHGPKVEGFIERQSIITGAAKKKIETFPVEDQTQLLAALNKLEDDFLLEMHEPKYYIEPDIIQGTQKQTAEEYYQVKHQMSEKLVAQYFKDVQSLIHHYVKIRNPKEKFSIQHLESVEKEFILERGRPSILNTYFIEGSEKQFFSMQKPASTENNQGLAVRPFLPSSIRDRQGLANYVITSFGTLNKTGGTYETAVQFEAIRHSSYPPIAVKKAHERWAMACKNCKNVLTDLAQGFLKYHPDIKTSPEEPLSIPLRSMILLTPKKIDFLRNREKLIMGKWIGESETAQLEECALALNMFNQRVLPLNVNGKEVWIKADISFLNMGSNPLAVKAGYARLLDDAETLKGYNAKGYMEFEQEVFSYLHSHLGESPALNKLREKIDGFNREKVELESLIKENDVSELYQQLEVEMENYLADPQTKTKDSIDRIKDSIHKREKLIYDKYADYVSLKSRAYREHREEYRDLFKELKNEMGTTTQPELERIKNLIIKFEKAMDIYHTQAFSRADFILDFQVLYIEIQEMMSNFVEFFCKSAEDRTGRVDDKVQENKIFESIYGYSPSTSAHQQHINIWISPLVHQYSASQNNTEHNSGARGEQISSVINSHLPARMGRKHAQMAKRVVLKAKKIPPSENLKRILEDISVNMPFPSIEPNR